MRNAAGRAGVSVHDVFVVGLLRGLVVVATARSVVVVTAPVIFVLAVIFSETVGLTTIIMVVVKWIITVQKVLIDKFLFSSLIWVVLEVVSRVESAVFVVELASRPNSGLGVVRA